VTWPLVPLGDVVEFLDHMRRPITAGDRTDGPYPYYGANGQQGTIDGYIFDEPLLLLAEDGGHFDDPLRGIAYTISGRTWVNNHAHVLRMGRQLDLGFARYALANRDVRKYVTGTTRAKLTKSGAAAITIPLPPIDEQRRIAAILDHSDDLRIRGREVVDFTNELAVSTFVDCFGDPTANPKNYPRAKLGEVISSASDGPHVSPKYANEGIPFLSTRHIKPGRIVWDDLKFLSPEDAAVQWRKCQPVRGDVLYTKGGTTGVAAAVNIDRQFAVWVHVALLKPLADRVNYIWLEAMLNTPHCYRQSQTLTHGIANRDLGLKRMVKIDMLLPPIEEQNSYADHVAQVRRTAELTVSRLSEFDSLFASLKSRAFSGQL
jgi:type I restriction enzyme, S subunit